MGPGTGDTGPWVAERTRRTVELLRILAPREFRTRYRQSVLDIAWSLISPVVILLVYGVILAGTFKVDGACSPYLSSAWTGLVVWTFFATAVGTAAWSLLGASDLLSKVYFPREVLPLAAVGATLVDLAVGAITVVIVVVVQQVGLTVHALGAIVCLLVVVVWAAGIAIFVAVLSVFLRDVTHGVQLLLRVGFFATPVMYEASYLPPALRWSASVNPVAVAIGGVRQSLLCGGAPRWGLILLQLVVGLVVVALGVAYTRSVESRMVDVI
jgi:lipopolysaccharide transport system permease protein